VAISPDVVSFIHRHSGCCDMFRRSGIRNVARKASSVSLATGMARNVTCCAAVPEGGSPGPRPPSPVPGRGFSFCAASVGGPVGAVLF
jgi:hypothetical protein